MVPKALFDRAVKGFDQTLTEFDTDDRKKIEAWMLDWLADEATKALDRFKDKRGIDWVPELRSRLIDLAKTIKLERYRDTFIVKASPRDQPTLFELQRGTRWFVGVDLLEAKLLAVVSAPISNNSTRETTDTRTNR